MDIEKQFEFLVRNYGLKYAYQDFKNCFGGYWWVYTHSFYNKSGCFTIHCLPQRGELNFYYAKTFSTKHDMLCECALDIFSIEKEVWEKHRNSGFLKIPSMWESNKQILNALAEVIEAQIQKNGTIFWCKNPIKSDMPH